jgi:hypothetical protein
LFNRTEEDCFEMAHSHNITIKNFIEQMPNITDNIRECMLYTVDLIDELKVITELVGCKGCITFVIQVPCFNPPFIPLFKQHFVEIFFTISQTDGKEAISCGPTSYDANKESIKKIIDWLAEFMPRCDETLWDIIEKTDKKDILNIIL